MQVSAEYFGAPAGFDFDRAEHDLPARSSDRFEQLFGFLFVGHRVGEFEVDGDHARAGEAQVIDDLGVIAAGQRGLRAHVAIPQFGEGGRIDRHQNHIGGRCLLAPDREARVDRLEF